jgi:hypothetical protein
VIPPIIEFAPGPRLDAGLARVGDMPGARGFAELLRAVQAGRIGLSAILNRKANWTARMIKSRLPMVVLIGDDHGNSSAPDRWRCSISAIAWARFAVVHGTGGEASHYARGIEAAEWTGRCLFVETGSDQVAAWVSAIAPRGIPGLMIIPPAGQVHPREAAR